MVKFEDYQFNYFFTGNTDKQPILFLHGFMGSSNDFKNAMAWLADHFYCLAVDLPGHGKTKVFKPEECYTMPNTARALLYLLDKLNIEKCSLVGYSMGGRLALYLAIHFPDRFAKVVLESASPGLKTTEEQLSRIQADSELAQELETIDFHDFLLRWYEKQLFKSLKQHPQFAELIERRGENNPVELARVLRQMGTGSQPALWKQIEENKIPLLLLVGQYDDKFKAINAEMARRCEVAKMKIIKGCGHNIHFAKMNVWVRYVKAFCK